VDKEVICWARDEVAYLKDFKEKLTPGGNTIPTPSFKCAELE